jgi:hypothetical protein
MSETPISKEEIKQLLFFMNRIKAFEKTFIVQKNTMARLIWGLLLVGAGILDFVIRQMAYEVENSDYLTLLPWIIAIFSGMIFQIFSDRHITNIYSWQKSQEEDNSGTTFISLGFILMGVVVVVTSTPDLYFLTFPIICLISGFMALITDNRYFKENRDILNIKHIYFIPIVCVILALVLLLSFMIDKSNVAFSSVIFGCGFGGSFSLIAFWNRKKVIMYIEQTDLD